MKINKHIMSIGDIHGRSSWKLFVFGGETEYFLWRQGVDEGYSEYDDKYKFHQYDKIIFVGDYVDSYDISNEDILENLKDIIHFARHNPGLVELLLGNHDISYIVPEQYCSGFRGEMYHDLNQLYKENADLFKLAYLDVYPSEYKGMSYNLKTLYTHAGVTEAWYKGLKRIVLDPNYRFYEMFKELNEIDEILNLAWELRIPELFNVDKDSGGSDIWAGPLWVRPRMLNEFSIDGYDQVVGHTRFNQIMEIPNVDILMESNPLKIRTVTYIDVLDNPNCIHQVNVIKRI